MNSPSLKLLFCIAFVISPLCSFANPPAKTPESEKPSTALDRLKALSLAVSQSKDEIAKSKTEEEVISALQTMEKRFSNLNPVKSEKPEPEPDKAEFMKSVPDISGLHKNFAQAIEKFENISLVSSQFNHSLRLHVYGRVMKSLTQEQVKKGIQQELELLATSTKMLTGSVSTFEKSAALLTDPSKADEKTRKNVHAQLSRAKHLVELTESSVNYLNKALTNPWFKESKNAE